MLDGCMVSYPLAQIQQILYAIYVTFYIVRSVFCFFSYVNRIFLRARSIRFGGIFCHTMRNVCRVYFLFRVNADDIFSVFF